jgi:hypothetical protein
MKGTHTKGGIPVNTIAQIIHSSIRSIPEAEGPIPVTPVSHPFCAMRYSRMPMEPDDFKYEELEFFLKGKANIYGADEKDYPYIKKTGIPYKNRIVLRRPRDMDVFSGRVYVDILNATQGYDIEDLWHRNYYWCMENGHGYVGITSKPICVMSLKNYDWERYQSLDWSNGEKTPQPAVLRHASIPGTEEGLFWDMLGQLASLLRSKNTHNGFMGHPADYLYLTGQSQSGAYLNTYIHYFDPFLTDSSGNKLFDGYMNIVGAQIRRRICQDEPIEPLRFYNGAIRPTPTPLISITSEGDVSLFKEYFQADILKNPITNSDTEDSKRRHYDIAGTPHTDICCPLLSSFEELKKTQRPVSDYSGNELSDLNDIPTEFYIVGLLEKLHLWAARGIPPATAEPFRQSPESSELLRDEHGNVLGGLRSPFLDVPIATYTGSNPKDPEGISGKITYFSAQKVEQLYGSFDAYLEKFTKYTQMHIDEGWVTEKDGKKMIQWAAAARHKLPAP